MGKFSISEYAMQSHAPAGLMMVAVSRLMANVLNEDIYSIGNIDLLEADIEENGVRSPLEVVRDGDLWRVVSGHRRLAACRRIAVRQGIDIEVPCIEAAYASKQDEAIALVTANATARELTDWERLRQYEVLKAALEEKKARGELGGRVRQAIMHATGDSSGTLARLEVIRKNAPEWVRHSLKEGGIGINRAYELSKPAPSKEKTPPRREAAEGMDEPCREKAAESTAPAGGEKSIWEDGPRTEGYAVNSAPAGRMDNTEDEQEVPGEKCVQLDTPEEWPRNIYEVIAWAPVQRLTESISLQVYEYDVAHKVRILTDTDSPIGSREMFSFWQAESGWTEWMHSDVPAENYITNFLSGKNII